LPGAASGQALRLGIKGGIPRSVFPTKSAAAINTLVAPTYLVGPSLEFCLGKRFGFEINALYLGSSSVSASMGTGLMHDTRISSAVEVPVIAKIRMKRSYMGAGIALRRLTSVSAGPSTHSGLLIASGTEFGLGRLRVGPEVRFTRSGAFNARNGIDLILRSHKYEGQLLFGITF
jgi:hypothetical protein